MMKMNKLIATTCAAALMLSSAVPVAFAADSATETFDVEATVANTCNIPRVAAPGAVETDAAYTDAGGTNNGISFDAAIDGTDASLNAGSVVLTYPDVMCNYAASVGVKSANGGMTQSSGEALANKVSGTFLDRIDYTATAGFCGVAPTITTAGVAIENELSCAGANTGNLILTVSTADGTDPILQGQYDDVLTLKIGATF